MAGVTNVRRDAERDWTWDGESFTDPQSVSTTYTYVDASVTAAQLDHAIDVLAAVRDALALEQTQAATDAAVEHAKALADAWEALPTSARTVVRDLLPGVAL